MKKSSQEPVLGVFLTPASSKPKFFPSGGILSRGPEAANWALSINAHPGKGLSPALGLQILRRTSMGSSRGAFSGKAAAPKPSKQTTQLPRTNIFLLISFNVVPLHLQVQQCGTMKDQVTGHRKEIVRTGAWSLLDRSGRSCLLLFARARGRGAPTG